MDRLQAMNTFEAVAKAGSFTKAAEKLNLSSQLVSKYVSQLEEHLGVRLLNRTTRRVHLTQEGEQCLYYVRQILEGVSDMEGHLGELQGEVQGLLSLSAPVSFATLHLPPLLSAFRQAHPAVGIDLQLNDRKVDLLEEGFDIALRIGYLKSSSLIAKRVVAIRVALCAAPEYLKQHGMPNHPEDLIPEHYLSYSYMDYDNSNSPLFEALKRSRGEQQGGLRCNNGQILVDAAIAGEGYVLQPTFIVGEAIRQGKLRPILEDYKPEATYLYALYPHRKLLSLKSRAFIEFLDNYYGEFPQWDAF